MQINPKIYKKLFNTPIVVVSQSSSDSLGDTQDSTSKTYLGYVYNKTEMVINDAGKEQLSHIQIYLRGDDVAAVKMTDLITCLDVVKQPIIAKALYRGPYNSNVIGIIYLP